MTESNVAEALRFLKGLADETRLRLIGILANGEHSVGELAGLLELKAPTVSHHLTILKNLGLVKMSPEGNTHLYRLDGEALRGLGRLFLTPESVVSLACPVGEEAWKAKVLRDFTEGERIIQMPVRHKKRLAILEWLAGEFDLGVRYPESRVNETLKIHYPDYATLRRELVDWRFMARENGVYWRLPDDEAGPRTERGDGREGADQA